MRRPDVDRPPAQRSASALAAHTFLTRVVTYTVGLPGSIMLARGLGAAGRGTYQLPVTVTSVLVFVVVGGIPQALYRTWSPSKLVAARALARRVGLALGSVGLVIGAVVFIIGRDGFLGPVPSPAYALVLSTLPVQAYMSLQSSVLTYAGAARHVNLAGALAVIVQTALFVAGALFDELTVTRTAAIYALGVAIQAVWLRRGGASLRPDAEAAEPVPWRPLLRVGVAFQPYILANHLLLRVDVLLLAAMSDQAEVGVYAVAVALAELTWNVTDSVLVPAIERGSSTTSVSADTFSPIAARTTVLLATTGALCVAVSTPLFVPFLYGTDFRDAVPVVLALLPGVVAMSLWRVCSLPTVRHGVPRVQVSISSLALAVNVVLNVLLIPEYGAVGAGISSSIAYGLAALLTVAWVARAGTATVRQFVVPTPDDARRIVAAFRTFLRRP